MVILVLIDYVFLGKTMEIVGIYETNGITACLYPKQFIEVQISLPKSILSFVILFLYQSVLRYKNR